MKGSNSKGTTECNRQQQQQQQQRHRRKVENNRFSFKFPSKGLQEIARSRKKLVIERSLLHPTTGLYVRSQCMCVSVGKRFFPVSFEEESFSAIHESVEKRTCFFLPLTDWLRN